jgi:hypothetical protein
VVQQNSLLHTKSLLVVSTSDFEDVSLELVTKGISGDFFRDALIVEDTPVEVNKK